MRTDTIASVSILLILQQLIRSNKGIIHPQFYYFCDSLNIVDVLQTVHVVSLHLLQYLIIHAKHTFL